MEFAKDEHVIEDRGRKDVEWGRLKMSEKEYILFCDESDRRGKYYSNFYGGVMVGASQYQRITQRLEETKVALNLFAEVKWEKVTAQYLDKYLSLMSIFFNEIRQINLRVRIMFRQNAHH